MKIIKCGSFHVNMDNVRGFHASRFAGRDAIRFVCTSEPDIFLYADPNELTRKIAEVAHLDSFIIELKQTS